MTDATMNMAQVRLLMLLLRQGETPVTVHWIARHIGHGLSTTSQRVDRLYKEGFIDRREDPEDRRRALVQLTADGGNFLRKLRDDLEKCEA